MKVKVKISLKAPLNTLPFTIHIGGKLILVDFIFMPIVVTKDHSNVLVFSVCSANYSQSILDWYIATLTR